MANNTGSFVVIIFLGGFSDFTVGSLASGMHAIQPPVEALKLAQLTGQLQWQRIFSVIKSIVPEHKAAAEVEWTYDDPGPTLESLKSLIPRFVG
jgi:hypothetical protein